MKAQEIIDNFREFLTDMRSPLSSRTDTHLMFILDEARAMIVGRQVGNRGSLQAMTPTLDLSPTVSSASEMGQIGSSSVIKVTVPTPVAVREFDGITMVSSADLKEVYTKVSLAGLQSSLYRKYTGGTQKYTRINNDLFIINSKRGISSKIQVTGVFDEPYKVLELLGKIDPFAPYDFEYPLSMKDARSVYEVALTSRAPDTSKAPDNAQGQ